MLKKSGTMENSYVFTSETKREILNSKIQRENPMSRIAKTLLVIATFRDLTVSNCTVLNWPISWTLAAGVLVTKTMPQGRQKFPQVTEQAVSVGNNGSYLSPEKAVPH